MRLKLESMTGLYDNMEVELVTEEDTFGVDDQNYDYATLEGERCGICMDIVIDRGVLDCCQHWFCFACIDNWATITNLCPLCQNEFQLITCVPVYDTIGSNNADDDLNSREDDWCIEGKNNTLSFPSYYIDENAVVCLDGDGCKIRSGSAAVEEDPNLDTSIACDSCDIWYHAFCVGFDPEGTCENSWLCPRCVVDEMPQNSDGVSVMRPINQLHPENASSEYLAEAALSGKVSVSVADVGETAVVVSMVEREESADEPNGNSLLSLDVCKDMKIDTLISGSGAYKQKFGTPSNQMIKIEPDLEAHELELSLSQVTSFDLPSSQLVLTELKTNFNDETTIKQNVIDENGISSSKKYGELYNNEPGLDLHLGISAGPPLSVDKMNNNIAEDQVDVDVQLKPGLEECLLPADKIVLDKKESVVGTTGAKRKHRDGRGVEDEEMKAKIQTKLSSKKVKAEGSSHMIYPKNQADKSVSDHHEIFPSPIAVCKGQKSRRISDKGNNTANIMDIVQGTDRRPVKRFAFSKLAGTSLTERENAAGLRVKKIMRRTSKEESSMLVQNLRKEIREAVRNRSSKEFGDNLYDPKLLAAFRAAVAAGPITENKRPPPLDLRAKKSLLQKGKIRESLTKKIYGSGGKRRHGWTRDCEIEFWKHRCLKFSRPEKIETLKSVLNLLRKSPESTEIKKGSERGSTGSILSRLYLADSSVFPRKDDIKPLSVINASETCPMGNRSAKGPQTNAFSSQVIVPKIDNEGETSSSKVHPNRSLEGSSLSTSDGSKADSQKETVGKSDDIKTDKRKWALQILARKTVVTGKNTAQEKQDTAVLKGNYPLLAQLPADMRPVLAPSRHNKIPISIRQTQLHRLTEHFLRKANTPVTQITAEIELAVADAVNIEKEVANRSNSKLVYVNLCSQELLHRSDNTLSGRATESNPNLTSANHAEKSEELPNGLSSCSEVEEALRNAGLLSDSPPNSPHHQIEEVKEEVDPSKNIKEEEPDNVFEIDSQPELDIYGDFEYDLEDEDFIGASTLKISKLEPEESKLKVVFSTLDSDRSNAAQGSENHEEQAIVEVPKGSSGLTDCENDTSTISSTTDNKTDECPPQSSLLDGGGEELSVAECEELYGPDKEPLIKRFPEGASIKPYELIPNNIDLGNNEDRESMKESEPTKVVHDSSGGKDSPNRSQKKVPRKEKISITQTNKSDGSSSVRKKVESYIKEHVRPLCKSGVITVEQYRWAVGKTSDKIMKYHSKDTNANFLIKEGEKVKKLAEQYVETAQKTGKM